MRSAQLTAARKIEIAEREPLSAGPGEAVIGVEYAGICGTDLALFTGNYPVPLPLVCGHEFTGRVKSVGPGVDARWVGRRVTAEINNTCLALGRAPCTACRRGLPGHCLNRTVTGIIQQDGAFAEECAVGGGCLHEIPETVDSLAAVLTEPLAAALQIFEMTPPQTSDVVVVLGPGRLGILIVFAAALRGLTVYAVSRSGMKRSRALDYGARETFTPEESHDAVRQRTEGLGADIVVDATGNPDGLGQALGLVRPRGTICCKTTCGLPETGLDMTRLVVNEIRVQGSRCGPFSPSLKLIESHQDRLKALITSIRLLTEAQSALESAFREDKVVLAIDR
ncbi:MAG: alcohol dehydrogenase [Nitrospinae bacterium CG11_big_fil_rev_8_21_14_0_20_56_8]|nr:MAG: alcohol dehydrogenase [Nitrospinae bacterium CG11_big_fil_rev_8_21_14_0_20_56_8]